MLYVSLRDGTVRKYDLRIPDEFEAWSSDSTNPMFVELIRGIALGSEGSRADLPAPKRFRRVIYRAEVLGSEETTAERISAICDDVVVSLTMYLNGRAGRFRCDVDRRGTARFIPR